MSSCEGLCGRPGVGCCLRCPACPLYPPPPPTCLWHACVVQSLTPAFVNRGKSRAWVIGDYSGEERERLTQQYNDREVGGDEGEVAGDRRTAGGEEETE